jgi:uncharacterized protein
MSAGYRVALAIALLASAAAADAPIPPAPSAWLTDNVALLSPETRRSVDEKLGAYERRTGHQIVVWIGSSVEPTLLEDFAVEAFQAWGIGRKGHDDGVLLVVLARDRRVAVEVGYGLEGALPDAIASRIINETMVPLFRSGQADRAVSLGVEAVLEAIEGRPFVDDGSAPGPEAESPTTGRNILFGVLVLAFLLLFITNPRLAMMLLFVMAGRGGGGGGGGGGFAGGGGRSGGGGARGSW